VPQFSGKKNGCLLRGPIKIGPFFYRHVEERGVCFAEPCILSLDLGSAQILKGGGCVITRSVFASGRRQRQSPKCRSSFLLMHWIV
jgi:hypothetical protein